MKYAPRNSHVSSMKNAACAIVLATAMGAAVPVSAQTRIMPLGDSITEAEAGHASYRYWLWHQLVNGGYDVDFVGSMSGVYLGAPLYEDFDQDHEGHWGIRADDVAYQVSGWAVIAEPVIVLVHLGTNDLYQGQSIESTIGDLATIVGELRALNPQIAVLIAEVIPSFYPALSEIPALNDEIAILATALNTPESPVIAVDQWTDFDPVTETYDGIHPNEAGEKKLSSRWFSALETLLGRLEPVSLPAPRKAGRRLTPSGRN